MKLAHPCGTSFRWLCCNSQPCVMGLVKGNSQALLRVTVNLGQGHGGLPVPRTMINLPLHQTIAQVFMANTDTEGFREDQRRAERQREKDQVFLGWMQKERGRERTKSKAKETFLRRDFSALPVILSFPSSCIKPLCDISIYRSFYRCHDNELAQVSFR